MSLFENFLMYELCFPGAVTGETEVECPYCQELLTVARKHYLGVTNEDFDSALATNPFSKIVHKDLHNDFQKHPYSQRILDFLRVLVGAFEAIWSRLQATALRRTGLFFRGFC